MERQIVGKPQKSAFRSNPRQSQSAQSAFSGHSLLVLQRSIGNQAMQGLINSPYIQTKLQVSTPGDPFEREADRVAETVMRMTEPQPKAIEGNEPARPLQAKSLATSITRLVQRAAEPEVEEENAVPAPTKMVLQRVPVAVREDDDEENEGKVLQAAPLIQRRIEEEEEEAAVQRKLFSSQPAQPPSQVFSRATSDVIHRFCTECEEVKEGQSGPMVHRTAVSGPPPENEAKDDKIQTSQPAAPTPSLVANVYALNNGGNPLPETTRAFFEPRFGVDFSKVRVHTDSRAVDTAKSINAKAFTFGQNIAFSAGSYEPDSREGRRLLAHELTHVVQQGGAAQTGKQGEQAPALQKTPEPQIMREGFDSTFQVCHNLVRSRNFEVTNGGVRVVLLLNQLDKDVVNCEDFSFGVTLTRSIDWWPDDDINTCNSITGGARSFSFSKVPPGTYYLTIERSFDHPYCCLEGGIIVYDEPVSADSSGCERDTDPSVMDVVHGALDIAGFIPVLGAIPDGINALIYVAEGDWENAGISAVAMVPIFGDGAKLVTKAGKEIIEVSGKTVVKKSKEELGSGLKQLAGKGEKEAAGKLEKEAAEKLEKELAEKELKKKIAECEAIYAAYNALKNCPSCKSSDTPAERAAKVACLTTLLAGRRKYLKEKCDYVLEGSIKRKDGGSAKAEQGHLTAAQQIVNRLAKCAKLPTS